MISNVNLVVMIVFETPKLWSKFKPTADVSSTVMSVYNNHQKCYDQRKISTYRLLKLCNALIQILQVAYKYMLTWSICIVFYGWLWYYLLITIVSHRVKGQKKEMKP